MEQLQTDHWLKEIEVRDLLYGDSEIIFDACGMDILIKLWETLPGLNLYISLKPLIAARKRYIAIHYNGTNVRKLAVKLGCSERFVYEVIGGKLGDFLPKKEDGRSIGETGVEKMGRG